jgi:hypothetical protein
VLNVGSLNEVASLLLVTQLHFCCWQYLLIENECTATELVMVGVAVLIVNDAVAVPDV